MMKKSMIDDNINDLVIKSIQRSLQVKSLRKKNVTKMMKQLMIDDNNINDFVIKSIQRSLQVKSLRKRM